MELTLMNNSDRLQLLKDISGASVYDEQKLKSQKTMDETRATRIKTNETLEYIQKRLAQLEEEQKELSAYQETEKKKRGLEFVLYDMELKETKEKIQALEEERAELILGLAAKRQDLA